MTAPDVPPPQAASLGRRLARLAPYFGRQKGLWGLALLATIAGASTEPLIPALLKPLLDQGFAGGTLPLWAVPLAVVALFALRGSAQFVASYALARIANDGMRVLRERLFQRLLEADLSLFARQSASALSNTVVYEVQTGATLLVQALLGLSRDGFTLLALLVYLFYLNWRLTLIVAILVPSVAWIMKTLSRRLYRLTKESQQATDDLAYVVEENVLAHRMIRLHGAQAAQARRFDALSGRLQRLAVRATIASAAMTPLTQLTAAIALSTVITIALWQSRLGAGSVTVGGFVAFITAMLMLVAPIRRLSDVANPITRGIAALERGLDLNDRYPAEASGHAHTESDGCANAVDWSDVTVRYTDDGPAALEAVTLSVRVGETIALVGPSGSGKTTLVNLLPRFVHPTAGAVRVFGRDVQQWSLPALRRQIAMVSQDVVMLNDTLAANVALGAEPDRARVLACLEAANLDGLVASLPGGIDTIVGHNATQLSGGQRQRLAIARALYKDAPLLILDEATSALDTESERLVQQALQRLMAGRTTLIVAHRLSTIEHADRVIVMAQGHIAEQGTHAELLAAGGLYARLHGGAQKS